MQQPSPHDQVLPGPFEVGKTRIYPSQTRLPVTRRTRQLGWLHQPEHASHIPRSECPTGIIRGLLLCTEEPHEGRRWGGSCDVQQKPVDDGLAHSLPLALGNYGHVLSLEVLHPSPTRRPMPTTRSPATATAPDRDLSKDKGSVSQSNDSDHPTASAMPRCSMNMPSTILKS